MDPASLLAFGQKAQEQRCPTPAQARRSARLILSSLIGHDWSQGRWRTIGRALGLGTNGYGQGFFGFWGGTWGIPRTAKCILGPFSNPMNVEARST
eukprot:7031248-Pyramimonas_sp.AAC.1